MPPGGQISPKIGQTISKSMDMLLDVILTYPTARSRWLRRAGAIAAEAITSAGAIAAAGAVAPAGPDFEAAGPDFEAAAP